MSQYKIGDIDEIGFQLERKEGNVEMWHKPETGSHIVILYEHANWDEYQLLTKTLYSREKADEVFNAVFNIIK